MNSQRAFVTGDYTPYYFEIFLETEVPLTDLKLLPNDIQRAYYHEFWHYLQNVTTTYGVMGTWQVYDKLRQLLAVVQQQPGVVQLPLTLPVQTEQKRIDDFIELQRGSGRLPENIPAVAQAGYTIGGVEVVNVPQVEAMFPGLNLGAVYLLIDHPVGCGLRYKFGETAISECMARLAEERHYGPAPQLSRFPYRIAEELAAREHPPVADGAEKLFALCDVALMHPLPGYAFYHLLQEMRDDGFAPSDGEAVIDYGMAKYRKWGWNIEMQRDQAVKGLQHVVDKLYQDDRYKETALWLKTIMVMGHNLRERDPFFALKIFLGKPFEGEMDQAWMEVGGPHCINRKRERSMQLPMHLRQVGGFVDKIFPQRLRMVKQFSDLLTKGTVACNSIEICSHSLPPIADDRCTNAPWERAQANELHQACPYAAAWVIWRLQGRSLAINDIAVFVWTVILILDGVG